MFGQTLQFDFPRLLIRLSAYILLSGLMLPGSLAGEDSPMSGPNRVVFQPGATEGYLQAWNLNFRNSDFLIYTSFVISNTGPGDRNHGVSVLVFHNNRSMVYTAEFDQSTLKARAGTFGYQGPAGYMRLQANGSLELQIAVRDLRLQLVFDEIQPGMCLTGGRLIATESADDFFQADIPVAFARASGSVSIQGHRHILSGSGGMEYLHTNRSPHVYARDFWLLRSYDPERGLFLGYLNGTDEFPEGRLARLVFMDHGRVVRDIRFNEMTVQATHRDVLSGFTLPMRSEFKDTSSGCRLQIQAGRFQGGYEVLSNVSLLLRWVLQLLFSRPYIVHYNAAVDLSCPSGADNELKSVYTSDRMQSTHYLLNE